MGMTFSERNGFVEVRKSLQLNDMDEGLRVDLWNLTIIVLPYFGIVSNYRSEDSIFCYRFWAHFLSRPADEMPFYANEITPLVKQVVLKGDWNRVYDLIELFLRFDEIKENSEVIQFFNDALEKNMSSYRVVGDRVIPIDSEIEIAAIEDAMRPDVKDGPIGVQYHLRRSLELLSARADPDYANSIKESISAVESLCQHLTGKAVLSDALKTLEASGFTIHRALRDGWLKIYGYASDADGVRHSAKDLPTADQALAKYFLISCSAFINLLTVEAIAIGKLRGNADGAD